MYERYTAGEISPRGWLRRQLEIQAEGLSGHLDLMWPDIRESGWIGGEREGWERVPYWLDGFIPLGRLLGDEGMIERADRYIGAILDRQTESGWICPCGEDKAGEYDLWALLLIGKVLAQYCELTASERAEKALYRAMKNLYGHLTSGVTLGGWGKYRWFEGLIPLIFLKERYGEEWIVGLGRILREQGADWESFIPRWIRPLDVWTFETHIVNIGMMIKYEELYCRLTGEKSGNRAEKMWRVLEKHNGTAVGTFTGDEVLAGLANNHGTELCAVAEQMYSCELLYAMTGDPVWADRLEKMAFNAYPATFTDDMWHHQYDQQVNQPQCVRLRGKSFFRTNGNDAHLFGIEPNYGCCTANLSQGWPKFAMSAFLGTKRGILCAHMLPAELNTKIGDASVCVTMDTEYPFRHTCRYTVRTDRAAEFELKIRIPRGVRSFTVDGERCGAKKYHTVRRVWEGETVITLSLEFEPKLVSRPHGLKCAEYGPLVFALPVKFEEKLTRTEVYMEEYADKYVVRELVPTGPWERGFASDSLIPREREGDSVPFSSQDPRLTLRAEVCPVRWELADGQETIAAAFPASRRAEGESEEVELYPYGCAKLRMTELPKAVRK